MATSFTLGLHVDGDGSHPAAWRDARHTPDRLLTGTHPAHVASRAQSAGFSYLTYAGSHLPPSDGADVRGRLDAVQSAAFTAPLTSSIGLIPQVPVTYIEPFHTATQVASIDYSSHGRAGVLFSAENSAEAAAQFGREALTADELAQEVVDVVAVNRLLWDSWEDDAVIRDLPTGRYFDREKLHYVDFVGAGFTVKGPSIIPRPPQGQLPVLVPAEHAAGVDADAVLVPVSADLAQAAEAARADRNARVIADLEIALDSRGELGADRLARLDARTPWAAGASQRFTGSADELVALLTELAATVDGVRLIPASLAIDLDELAYAVLPQLLAAGVLVAPHPGQTLRETFGLPVAANVFAAEGAK